MRYSLQIRIYMYICINMGNCSSEEIQCKICKEIYVKNMEKHCNVCHVSYYRKAPHYCYRYLSLNKMKMI